MNINEILNLKEGENCEFKEGRNRFSLDELAQYLSALSNSGGGRIIFGISDKHPRQIVGTQAFDQPERTRMEMIRRLGINVGFEVLVENQKRVLIFEVPNHPIGLPVYADGKPWWRIGDSMVIMHPEILRDIYAQVGHDFSGDVCPQAVFADLDPQAIAVFRENWYTKTQTNGLKYGSSDKCVPGSLNPKDF